MSTSIPPIAELRQRLVPINHAGLRTLSQLSGVSFTTLMKIRQGYTDNPTLSTITKIVEALAFVSQVAVPAARGKSKAAAL